MTRCPDWFTCWREEGATVCTVSVVVGPASANQAKFNTIGPKRRSGGGATGGATGGDKFATLGRPRNNGIRRSAHASLCMPALRREHAHACILGCACSTLVIHITSLVSVWRWNLAGSRPVWLRTWLGALTVTAGKGGLTGAVRGGLTEAGRGGLTGRQGRVD